MKARIERLDWRRQDSVYAAASLAAVALIAFLVAGTFGLVASPFGPTPSSADLAVPVRTAPAPEDGNGLAGPSPAAAPEPAPPAVTAAASATDRTAPTAAITSSGGTEITLLQRSRIAGTASDAATGVSEVVVTFERNGERVTAAAELGCRDATRRSCTWSTDVPAVAGSYVVTATAVDRAGNTGESDPVQITVVNIGGPVQEATDAEDGLLDEVTSLLRSLVG